MVSASAVILSGSPLKNSWERQLRSRRGAGECRLLSGPQRAVASLCTPPKRVWNLLKRPTPSQVTSPTPTTSRRLTSSPTQSP